MKQVVDANKMVNLGFDSYGLEGGRETYALPLNRGSGCAKSRLAWNPDDPKIVWIEVRSVWVYFPVSEKEFLSGKYSVGQEAVDHYKQIRSAWKAQKLDLTCGVL